MADDFSVKAKDASGALIKKFSASGRTLALAESCTAGLVSQLLAGTPGASAVLWGSFVCYSPEAKTAMLGIEKEKIAAFGLVSGETAQLMACGALEKSGADIAAAVTGLAGPEGDGSAVPVGTVWVAAARKNRSETGELFEEAKKFNFSGSRNEVRLQAAIAVLELLDIIFEKK